MSNIPAPDIIKPLNYEQIYQSILAQFQTLMPNYSALLESDPAIKLLQIAAYRELLLRERINVAARASLLAFAVGGDLDNIGYPFDCFRNAGETDDQYRERIPKAMEGITTAGSREAYEYHAYSADGNIKDISVTSPAKGEVLITVMGKAGIDVDPILSKVDSALNEDHVRPLTDHVSVIKVIDVTYQVEAEIFVNSEPQKQNILAKAIKSLNELTAKNRAIGKNIHVSAISSALHVEGVVYASITKPVADVVISETQGALITSTAITIGGIEL